DRGGDTAVIHGLDRPTGCPTTARRVVVMRVNAIRAGAAGLRLRLPRRRHRGGGERRDARQPLPPRQTTIRVEVSQVISALPQMCRDASVVLKRTPSSASWPQRGWAALDS